jgi:hypothetical protein
MNMRQRKQRRPKRLPVWTYAPGPIDVQEFIDAGADVSMQGGYLVIANLPPGRLGPPKLTGHFVRT